jgi:CubicO group peptidase (beta-lactamase class C family)
MADRTSAQDVDSAQLSRVEALLRQRYPDSVPGVVVGIVSGGKLVYVGAHGFSDLEAAVPMTPRTRFNVMSLAKQFTAACIGLLVLDGKLSLDDDVRIYVPELPDYGAPIRIRHLVFHTSGLRDVSALWTLAGGSPENERGREAHLQLLFRQRRLNFTPGEAYLYSNSGYILLALVVERVSGIPFPEFARRNLFAPLAMNETSFAEVEPEPGASQIPSYRRDTSGNWLRMVGRDRRTGASDLITTIPDLALWVANFDEQRVGGASLAALMETRGVLSNGDTIEYAFGNIVDRHEGFREILHSGGLLGIRCKISRFPERKLGLIYCGNGSPAHNEDFYAIANILLLDAAIPETRSSTPPREPAGTPAGVSASMAAFSGRYASEELAADLVVETHSDGLLIRARDNVLARGIVISGDAVARASHPELGSIEFQFVRASSAQPARLVISTDRVRTLSFTRIE